jgi:hypothetical protein
MLSYSSDIAKVTKSVYQTSKKSNNILKSKFFANVIFFITHRYSMVTVVNSKHQFVKRKTTLWCKCYIIISKNEQTLVK